jgi:multiple sugar transport system substrate-binding protein
VTGDCNNHFLATLWTFGGALQTEDGKFGVKGADDKAWLDTLRLTKAMFEEDKIVPPGSINWDAGGNNNAYQGGQVWATSNPTSIYVWLLANKPDLAKATKFYPYPKGPAGEYGQVDVWANIVFKASKVPDLAKGALENFAGPASHRKYVQDLKGRFLPVYKNLVDDPMWKGNPLFEQYTTIAKNGRIMAYNASPTAPYADITSNNLIGTMIQDVLVKKQAPEQALQTFVTQAKAIYDKYPNL